MMASSRSGVTRRFVVAVSVLATVTAPWVASAAADGAATSRPAPKPTTTTAPPTTVPPTTVPPTTVPPTTSTAPTTTSPPTTSTTTTSSTTTTTTTSSTTSTTTTTTVPGGGVTANKTYTVDVDGSTVGAAPNAWAGDVNAELSVTITNTSPSQSLGSANLTVPAPYMLISSAADNVPGGPVVELRNLGLAPGGSTVVTLVVAVDQCTSGTPAPFTVTAKQSNDYKGEGNDFTLAQPSDLQVDVAGTCALVWVAAPSDAERGATITSVAWNPNGAPLVVAVLDAGGVDRATRATGSVTLTAFRAGVTSGVLGGTTSAAITAGLATFTPGPTLSPSAFDYAFAADSPGLVGIAPSADFDFDIVDQAVSCPGNSPCNGAATASAGEYSVSAQFGAGATPTHLTVSINAADAPSFECAGYPRGDLPVSQFVFTADAGDDRLGTFTTSFPGANPVSNYEVCWAAPYTFTTESGAVAAPGGVKPGTGQQLYVGLLPDCERRGAPTRPCVSRSYDSRTHIVTITVFATGEDPWKY